MIHIRPELVALFADLRTVDDFQAIEGRVVRRFKNRFTMRFERGGRGGRGGRGFYMKYHGPTGYWPIIEDWLRWRRPSVGAEPEVWAIERLEAVGLPTMRIAAWGKSGRWPPRQRSFVVTEEITGVIDLETLVKQWANQPPTPRFRRNLVRAVAHIARQLHVAGLNHRDFYLCHFLLETMGDSDRPMLYLIDLHRVQQRRHVPFRWRVKDLGGLYFSAMDAGLTRRDELRFIKDYTDLPLGKGLRGKPRLWHRVQKRARSMYQKHWGVAPPGRI